MNYLSAFLDSSNVGFVLAVLCVGGAIFYVYRLGRQQVRRIGIRQILRECEMEAPAPRPRLVATFPPAQTDSRRTRDHGAVSGRPAVRLGQSARAQKFAELNERSGYLGTTLGPRGDAA